MRNIDTKSLLIGVMGTLILFLLYILFQNINSNNSRNIIDSQSFRHIKASSISIYDEDDNIVGKFGSNGDGSFLQLLSPLNNQSMYLSNDNSGPNLAFTKEDENGKFTLPLAIGYFEGSGFPIIEFSENGEVLFAIQSNEESANLTLNSNKNNANLVLRPSRISQYIDNKKEVIYIGLSEDKTPILQLFGNKDSSQSYLTEKGIFLFNKDGNEGIQMAAMDSSSAILIKSGLDSSLILLTNSGLSNLNKYGNLIIGIGSINDNGNILVNDKEGNTLLDSGE